MKTGRQEEYSVFGAGSRCVAVRARAAYEEDVTCAFVARMGLMCLEAMQMAEAPAVSAKGASAEAWDAAWTWRTRAPSRQ